MNELTNTGQRILIVDDDPVNLSIVSEILDDEYKLKMVESGEEALQVLSSYNPDLILLDIMMPGISGLEVCEKIRENTKYRFTKILLVSGKALNHERLAGYRVGADDYITKPFVDDELRAKVDVYLRLKYAEEAELINHQVISQFSSGSATPLTRILSAADILMNDSNLNEEQREILHMINEGGEQLLQSVERSQQVNKLKKGYFPKRTDEPLDMNIGHKLVQVAKDFHVEQVSFHAAEGIKYAADWEKLDLAFEYIFQYCLDMKDEKGGVEVKARANNNAIHIRITTDAIKPAAFQSCYLDHMFLQAPQEINEQIHMLGLATAREIIIAHEGRIEIYQNGNNQGVVDVWLK